MDGKIRDQMQFSQIIDFSPYPIAIFTPQYKLSMVNKAFEKETKMLNRDLEEGNIRILQCNINDMQMASAITKVFAGETTFLEGLKDPFFMFSKISPKSIRGPDCFSKAVIFPIPAEDGEAAYGVIAFMP